MSIELINKSFTSFIQLAPSWDYKNFKFGDGGGKSSDVFSGDHQQFMMSTDFEIKNYSFNMRNSRSKIIIENLLIQPLMERNISFEYGLINLVKLYFYEKSFSEDAIFEFKESHYNIQLDDESIFELIKCLNIKKFNETILTIFLSDAVIEQTLTKWEDERIANPLLITDFSLSYR